MQSLAQQQPRAGTAMRASTHRTVVPRPARLTAGARLNGAASLTVQPGALDHHQRKVAIFVEPSPFSHISGMKNRFESLIKGLREAGDDVMVVTPDPTPPKEFCGAKVRPGRVGAAAKGREEGMRRGAGRGPRGRARCRVS